MKGSMSFKRKFTLAAAAAVVTVMASAMPLTQASADNWQRYQHGNGGYGQQHGGWNNGWNGHGGNDNHGGYYGNGGWNGGGYYGGGSISFYSAPGYYYA